MSFHGYDNGGVILGGKDVTTKAVSPTTLVNERGM